MTDCILSFEVKCLSGGISILDGFAKYDAESLANRLALEQKMVVLPNGEQEI